MSTEKTIRWGMIGCGQVTEVKSGPGFQKADHSCLQAVMCRNGELAKDYAQRHGVPKYTDDSDELIHDSEVDAVYIATPPHVHHDYVQQVAKAGKPVYVEKPMALNYQQCIDMNTVCEKAGVPLWVAYYRRALPKFLTIKSLLEKGLIGETRSVMVTFTRPFTHDLGKPLPWRVQPEIAGGGFFMDLGCHTLDFLDFLFGPIQHVAGHVSNQGKKYPAEDTVSGSFMFTNGILGSAMWSFDSFVYQDKVDIIGTHGMLTFSSFGTDHLQCISKNGEQQITIDHPKHVQQPLIQSMVNELNGQGKCPSDGMSAARTAKVMQAMMSGEPF